MPAVRSLWSLGTSWSLGDNGGKHWFPFRNTQCADNPVSSGSFCPPQRGGTPDYPLHSCPMCCRLQLRPTMQISSMGSFPKCFWSLRLLCWKCGGHSKSGFLFSVWSWKCGGCMAAWEVRTPECSRTPDYRALRKVQMTESECMLKAEHSDSVWMKKEHFYSKWDSRPSAIFD